MVRAGPRLGPDAPAPAEAKGVAGTVRSVVDICTDLLPSRAARWTTGSSAEERSDVPHSSGCRWYSASTPCGSFIGTIRRWYDLDQLGALRGGGSASGSRRSRGSRRYSTSAVSCRNCPRGAAWRANSSAAREKRRQGAVRSAGRPGAESNSSWVVRYSPAWDCLVWHDLIVEAAMGLGARRASAT